MVKKKHKIKRKDWHHRVPDFKLVYCGPKKDKEKKVIHKNEKAVEVAA
jgi:hypothetical protein